jgi:hypothetical protein
MMVLPHMLVLLTSLPVLDVILRLGHFVRDAILLVRGFHHQPREVEREKCELMGDGSPPGSLFSL